MPIQLSSWSFILQDDGKNSVVMGTRWTMQVGPSKFVQILMGQLCSPLNVQEYQRPVQKTKST
jgi:hypothetical protein